MYRRDFIINTIFLGCLGSLFTGCKNSSEDRQNLKNDKFYFRSKEDLPKRIQLEACSLCQLNCPECMARRYEKQAPKDWLGYLKFDDFKKFVDDNEFINEIELANKGEIFLNPELDEIIKYAYYKDVYLTATTGVNLNNVSEKTLENLVKYKFSILFIALDGATPETYKIYRRGGDFNRVIDNIKKINYYKKKYSSEYPKLVWQFIPFGHNEHEIDLAKQKAKELNMKIEFRRNYSPNYSPVKNKKLVEQKTGMKIFHTKNEAYQERLKEQKLFACYQSLKSPQIDYNGDLLCHCRVSTAKFSANAFKDGLLSALNSPDFIYAKHMLTDLSIPPKEGIPCTRCPKYKFLRRNNQIISL